MPPVVSEWNPNGDDANCAACVARYMYHKVNGAHVDDATSRGLDLMSAPEEVSGHAPNPAFQMRSAIGRTKSVIESTGLREVGRLEASPMSSRYPAGHYALIGLADRGGHVVYGRVDHDNAGFAEIFCPQSRAPYTLGRLGGRALAIRFARA